MRRLIVTDSPEAGARFEGAVCLTPDRPVRFCVGCFGCWVRTPGRCALRDDYQRMGETLARADELVLISRCCFGSWSPFVKNVLDRSISYLHPDFRIRNGELHHRARYDHSFALRALFYGPASEAEKRTARELARANALNLYAWDCETAFWPDLSSLLVEAGT